MTNKNLLFVRLYLSTLMVLLVLIGVSAQVTIGSENLPSKVSLLDLDTKPGDDLGIKRGLHLPRLTSAQRNVLVTPDSVFRTQSLAVGLMIYNTDIDCLEFWSGSCWVSLCTGDTPAPCFGFTTDYTFCNTSNPTIADLTAAVIGSGGNSTVQWYASPTDGSPLGDAVSLLSTDYWADCGLADRVAISVTVDNCLPLSVGSGRISSFTNVVYDIQTQLLQAFTETGGVPSGWQWQVNLANSSTGWQNITGATSANFVIPAGFMYSAYTGIIEDINDPANNPRPLGFNIRELYFRCVLSNDFGPSINSNVLGIEFIRTNTAGYGGDGTPGNPRYLTLGLGANGDATGQSGSIKMALFNLGADENDRIGIGDLYQWGRIADGHQHVVWTKTPSRINTVEPMVGGTGTSAVVAKSAVVQNYNATSGQIINTSGVGYFITDANDWGEGNVASNNRWGNSTNDRANADIWQRPGNNPCAALGAGWTVPSRWTWWDIYIGDGVSSTAPITGAYTAATNNTMRWRSGTAINAGGAYIINHSGEVVFLPAIGFRNQNTGVVDGTGGAPGYYWSSSFSGNTQAFSLIINGSSFGGASHPRARATGLTVRCVSK